MKRIAIVLALTAVDALAFNSAEWLEKRELFAREAERLMAVYSNCVANAETPAEDVVIPVETFEDGSVKTVVTAKKARYLVDRHVVWAENVSVKKFERGGETEGSIDARNCVIDLKAKSGWADGWARVIHGGTTFVGKGVFFSSPDSYVRVLRHASIESKDLKLGRMRP